MSRTFADAIRMDKPSTQTHKDFFISMLRRGGSTAIQRRSFAARAPVLPEGAAAP
jgi:hypothetical protein